MVMWFDAWEKFLVEYGFGTYDANGKLVVEDEMKKRILNMDETCMSLDSGNGNRGGRPEVTYHDIFFMHLLTVRMSSNHINVKRTKTLW